ncbi:programmed cell death 2 C-terminal domain-containing protein [Zea mays]|uniref:Programmed cell death 2 C-terminal domain-containing protein n=1 Tax=Zea mays TaxID=4577 RepID=A0A1D6HW12_MAIZE|nr:programmed cell death 2 C-terminal domain-containing protein [Zea mays]
MERVRDRHQRSPTHLLRDPRHCCIRCRRRLWRRSTLRLTSRIEVAAAGGSGSARQTPCPGSSCRCSGSSINCRRLGRGSNNNQAQGPKFINLAQLHKRPTTGLRLELDEGSEHVPCTAPSSAALPLACCSCAWSVALSRSASMRPRSQSSPTLRPGSRSSPTLSMEGDRGIRVRYGEQHAADSGIQGLAFSISVTTTVLPCFTYIMIIGNELYGGKGTVGSNISELVLDKEAMDAANDEEERWEGEKYSYGGKLLLATTKLQDPGTCRLCGSPRQYELQLMSSLSTFSMKLEMTPQIMYPAAGLG